MVRKSNRKIEDMGEIGKGNEEKKEGITFIDEQADITNLLHHGGRMWSILIMMIDDRFQKNLWQSRQ